MTLSKSRQPRLIRVVPRQQFLTPSSGPLTVIYFHRKPRTQMTVISHAPSLPIIFRGQQRRSQEIPGPRPGLLNFMHPPPYGLKFYCSLKLNNNLVLNNVSMRSCETALTKETDMPLPRQSMVRGVDGASNIPN